jgi:HlyD family secretion protein
MRQQLQRAASDPEGQVGLALAGVGLLAAGWFCLWRVPTEVVGRGVLIVPGGATVIDARAPGQILRIPVQVGEQVRRGQLVLELYLPTLEQELRRQQRDQRELIRLNDDLNRRDGLRLASARRVRDTALSKLARDLRRYRGLRNTYDQKVSDFRHLARQEVVAPLAQEVVATEDRATQLDVAAAELKIREKEALDAYQKVKLEVETAQLQRRYRIDELGRAIQVTRTRLAYDGKLLAERDGQILDIQVVRGQTVKAGQRLGTLGGQSGGALQAVAYFSPADARRLPLGLPVEVVPDWNERARFGGMLGRVERVSLLPATRDDVDTTMGNPQLAEALVKDGPVMRAEISLRRRVNGSDDGYRWTLSRGSSVFPIREGLTLKAHGYVEWRTPLSYVLPALRDLTGSYRTLRQERQATPQLRQR